MSQTRAALCGIDTLWYITTGCLSQIHVNRYSPVTYACLNCWFCRKSRLYVGHRSERTAWSAELAVT